LDGSYVVPSHVHDPVLRQPVGNPTADAAARLVALEVATQQQAATLTTTSKQMDKLQARVSTVEC
jgi:hypothetical protein